MGSIIVRDVEIVFDDNDSQLVQSHKWYLLGGYAVTYIKQPNGKRKVLSMHRLFMGQPEGMDIDHINRIRTDNRRCNLRICTRGENLKNKAKQGKSSQYKGVTFSRGKWQVVIRDGKKLKWLGYFSTEDEAAKVAAPFFEAFPT